MFKAKHFLMFLVLFSVIETFSQSVYLKHFNTEDGIPSSEVLDLEMDVSGRLWIVTGYGLCVYDGFEFKTYTNSSGMSEVSFVISTHDKNKNPWFGGYMGSLSFIKDNAIHKYSFNSQLMAFNNFKPFEYIAFPDNNTLLFSSHVNDGLFSIQLNDTKFHPIKLIEERDDYSLMIGWYKNTLYARKRRNALDVKEYKNLSSVESDNYYFQIPLANKYKTVLFSNNSISVVGLGQYLFYFKNQKLQCSRKFGNDTIINTLFIDDEASVWIGTESCGAFKLTLNLETNNKGLLEKNCITAIVMDNEKNLWFSTLKNGIYMMPPQIFRCVPEITLPVNSILKDREKRLIACTGGLFVLNNIDELGPAHVSSFINPKFSGVNRFLFKENDGTLWVLGSESMKIHVDGRLEILKNLSLQKPYRLAEISSGGYWIASGEGLLTYCKDSTDIFTGCSLPAAHFTCLHEVKNLGILAGSHQGLFVIQQANNQIIEFKQLLADYWITDIISWDNRILVATRGNGILLLNNQFSPVQVVQISDGLPSNMINEIIAEKKNVVIAATNKGLARIRLSDKQIVEIQSYDIGDGLASNEITALDIDSQLLWVGTSKGVSFCNLSGLEKKIVFPKIYIQNILISGKEREVKQMYTLDHEDNNINILLGSIYFRSPEKVIFRYRIIEDSKWYYTSVPEISLQNLAYGKNTIEVMAGISLKQWSNEKLIITFIIKKPFTQTIGFIIIVFVTLLSFGFVVFRIYDRNQKSRNRRKESLLLAEIKALRSQMNPHFIFNALNSLQYFIFNNEKIAASQYLTDLSCLVRKVLDQSSRNVISLEEEVDTIKSYLKIEKIRFEKDIDIEIVIDNAIDTLTYIPPMLIQPLIENAIWHGLIPSDRDKRLKICFMTHSKTYIRCSVEDNGIGREQSRKINLTRTKRESISFKNIRQRLQLLNNLLKSEMELTITDLYDENGRATGTRSELTIYLAH